MADSQRETWTIYVSNTSVDNSDHTNRRGMDRKLETSSQNQPIISRVFIYLKNLDGL